jgi:hypothetical protein
MLEVAARVYRETRKKNDLLFNVYVMRPIAAQVVASIASTRITPNQLTLLNLAVFVLAAAILVAFPSYPGGVAALAVLELSYCLDCADGMLARWKKTASKVGGLFDFFTDEAKATLLAGGLAVRLWRTGGFGFDAHLWPAGDARFLLGGIAGVAGVASALSLTNFVRNPEVSGREQTVEAYYETVARSSPRSLGSALTTFLRFLNHYPSHLWLWAIVGRMDAYFWVWIALNLLYLARGWLGLALRLGR